MKHFLLVSLLVGNIATAAESEIVLNLSNAAPGSTLPAGWKSYAESRHKSTAQMAVVSDGTQNVFRIETDHNAGGIVYPLDMVHAPVLQWHWKVDHSVAAADFSRKPTDDQAARVYVFFDMPPSQLTVGERIKLRLARTITGMDLPRAALCYVWDNKHPIGTITPSVYYSKVKMVVLQSGDAHAGQWRTEHRDLAVDYRAAFGSEPPRITEIRSRRIRTTRVEK